MFLSGLFLVKRLNWSPNQTLDSLFLVSLKVSAKQVSALTRTVDHLFNPSLNSGIHASMIRWNVWGLNKVVQKP